MVPPENEDRRAGDSDEEPDPIIYRLLGDINKGLGSLAEAVFRTKRRFGITGETDEENPRRATVVSTLNPRTGDIERGEDPRTRRESDRGSFFENLEARINRAFDPTARGFGAPMSLGGALMSNKLLGGAVNALGGPGKIAIEGAVRAIGAAVDKIGEQLNDFNDVNERLAVINSNLAETTAGNTDALVNNTMGFGLAAKALAELRIAGFEQTNSSLIELTTRMKISGQDQAAVISLGKSLIGIGGQQESSVDMLAEAIIDSSKTYGVTMGSIVEAVDGLSDNLKSLNVMGGGESATQITAKLAGIMDEELIPQVSFLMKELTSTTADLNVQAALGAERFGDMIATGQLTAANLPEVLNNLQEISQRAVMFVDQNDGSRRQLAASFGGQNELVMTLAAIAPALKEATTAPRAQGDKLMNTLTVFNEIVLSDFKNAVAGLLPSFMVLLKGLSSTVGGFLSAITRIIGPIGSLIVSIVGKVLQAVGLVFQGIAAIFEFLGAGVNKFFNAIGLGGVGQYFFGDGDQEVGGMGSLDTLSKMFNTLMERDLQRPQAEAIGSAVSQAMTDTQYLGGPLSTNDITRKSMLALIESNLGIKGSIDNLVTAGEREASLREKEQLNLMEAVDIPSDIISRAAFTTIDIQARRIDDLQQEQYLEGLKQIFGEEVGKVVNRLELLNTTTKGNKPVVDIKT